MIAWEALFSRSSSMPQWFMHRRLADNGNLPSKRNEIQIRMVSAGALATRRPSPDLHAGLRYGCAPGIAARSRSAYNCNAGNLEQARMMAESQSQMAGGTVESRDERHLFPMLGATTIVLLIAACKL